MKLDSLVESESDDGDDDDGDVRLETADGNTESNIEDNMSSAELLKKAIDEMNAVVTEMMHHETRRPTRTDIMEEQHVTGDMNTTNIGATIVYDDDDDDDGTHAITIVPTDNKNDEDESEEKVDADDDSRHIAALLFKENTDDEDALKENRAKEQTQYRKINSGEKTENHPCFRYPKREKLDGAEHHFQPLRDELRPKEEREKWEIVKRKQNRKKKTDNTDSAMNDHNDDDSRIVIDADQRELEYRTNTDTKHQKEVHRNEDLDKWEINTKNRQPLYRRIATLSSLWARAEVTSKEQF